MNFLKTAFAILTSVVLVGTQTVFAAQPAAAKKAQVCGCCACKKMNCCMALPTSTPQPIPTAPARTDSQNNLQIIAAVASLLLQSPEKITEPVSFAPISPLRLTAIPLYELNCSYLI